MRSECFENKQFLPCMTGTLNFLKSSIDQKFIKLKLIISGSKPIIIFCYKEMFGYLNLKNFDKDTMVKIVCF